MMEMVDSIHFYLDLDLQVSVDVGSGSVNDGDRVQIP